MKKATPNKVQQKYDDLTSKTPEPDQINQDHNNPSNNLITPIINNKSQIAQNKTAIQQQQILLTLMTIIHQCRHNEQCRVYQ